MRRRSTLKALSHRDNQGIAFLGADHGQADARVAGRCLDDGLAGLEGAVFLGRLDDGQGQPVLDRATGIEGLDLDVHVHVLGARACSV